MKLLITKGGSMTSIDIKKHQMIKKQNQKMF